MEELVDVAGLAGDEAPAVGRADIGANRPAAVPSPYVPHKSPPIDFRALHWSQNLSGPHDPNCCSSASIEIELALAADVLRVKSYRFVLPTPMPDAAAPTPPPSAAAEPAD